MQTRELVATGKAIVKKTQRDQLTDRAAAMTYYTLMALFPGLLLGVSVLGLVGQGSLYQDMIDKVRDVAPADLIDPLEKFLASATSNDAASITFVISLVIGLNGASGALAAAGRGLNVVLGVKDDRGLVHRKLHDMGWTLLLIALVTVAMGLIFLGGPLAEWAFDQIGLGGTAVTVWTLARWPLAILVMMLVYAIVYRVAPDADERRFRFLTPGSVIGVLIWAVASGAFFLYVSNFSSYNRTYGAFATAIVLLIWLWLSNLCLLVGGEINAVLDERRCGVSHEPEGLEVARQRGDAGAPSPDAPPGATTALQPQTVRATPRRGGLVSGLALVVLAMLALLPARRAR
jgi:membrane protein